MAAASDSEELNFWPGYVDTLVNMVMFLILLIVILSMAVMYFSMKARSEAQQSSVPLKEPTKAEYNKVYPGMVDELPKNPTMEDMRNLIDRLKQKLHQSELRFKPSGLNPELKADAKERGNNLKNEPETHLNKDGKSQQNLAASAGVGNRTEGIEALALRPSVIVVRFKPGTLDLNAEEAKRLADVFAKHFEWSAGSAQEFVISTTAVEGLSESNRMAFYRVVAVRNQLMSVAGVPAARIRQRIVPVSASQATGAEALEVRIGKPE